MTEVRQVKNFIDGEYRVSSSTFELPDPATSQLVAIVHEASADDVDDAVTAARRALNGPWARMSMADRDELMRKACDLILSRKDEFVAAEIADSGHPISAVSNIEIPRGAQQRRQCLITAGITSLRPLKRRHRTGDRRTTIRSVCRKVSLQPSARGTCH